MSISKKNFVAITQTLNEIATDLNGANPEGDNAVLSKTQLQLTLQMLQFSSELWQARLKAGMNKDLSRIKGDREHLADSLNAILLQFRRVWDECYRMDGEAAMVGLEDALCLLNSSYLAYKTPALGRLVNHATEFQTESLIEDEYNKRHSIEAFMVFTPRPQAAEPAQETPTPQPVPEPVAVTPVVPPREPFNGEKARKEFDKMPPKILGSLRGSDLHAMVAREEVGVTQVGVQHREPERRPSIVGAEEINDEAAKQIKHSGGFALLNARLEKQSGNMEKMWDDYLMKKATIAT